MALISGNASNHRTGVLCATGERPSRRKGIAVVEMVGAFVVLTVIVTVAAVCISRATEQRRELFQRCVAREAIANTMELIHTWPFEQVPARAAALRTPDWVNQQLANPRLEVTSEKQNALPVSQRVKVRLTWSGHRWTARKQAGQPAAANLVGERLEESLVTRRYAPRQPSIRGNAASPDGEESEEPQP